MWAPYYASVYGCFKYVASMSIESVFELALSPNRSSIWSSYFDYSIRMETQSFTKQNIIWWLLHLNLRKYFRKCCVFNNVIFMHDACVMRECETCQYLTIPASASLSHFCLYKPSIKYVWDTYNNELCGLYWRKFHRNGMTQNNISQHFNYVSEIGDA